MAFQHSAKCDGDGCSEHVQRDPNERQLPPGWLRRNRADSVGAFSMDLRSTTEFEVTKLYCPRCSRKVDPPMAEDLKEQQTAVLRTLAEPPQES